MLNNSASHHFFFRQYGVNSRATILQNCDRDPCISISKDTGVSPPTAVANRNDAAEFTIHVVHEYDFSVCN